MICECDLSERSLQLQLATALPLRSKKSTDNWWKSKSTLFETAHVQVSTIVPQIAQIHPCFPGSTVWKQDHTRNLITSYISDMVSEDEVGDLESVEPEITGKPSLWLLY